MSLADARAAFLDAHIAWARGDLAAFLEHFDEDIVHTVNVDGIAVPYAASAVGKEDVRWRLQHLLDTFVVTRFDVELLVHEADYSRSLVHGCYLHKRTGEVLDIRVQFRGWLRQGRLVRLEEVVDATYVEAFERFVRFLQQQPT